MAGISVAVKCDCAWTARSGSLRTSVVAGVCGCHFNQMSSMGFFPVELPPVSEQAPVVSAVPIRPPGLSVQPAVHEISSGDSSSTSADGLGAPSTVDSSSVVTATQPSSVAPHSSDEYREEEAPPQNKGKGKGKKKKERKSATERLAEKAKRQEWSRPATTVTKTAAADDARSIVLERCKFTRTMLGLRHWAHIRRSSLLALAFWSWRCGADPKARPRTVRCAHASLDVTDTRVKGSQQATKSPRSLMGELINPTGLLHRNLESRPP